MTQRLKTTYYGSVKRTAGFAHLVALVTIAGVFGLLGIGVASKLPKNWPQVKGVHSGHDENLESNNSHQSINNSGPSGHSVVESPSHSAVQNSPQEDSLNEGSDDLSLPDDKNTTTTTPQTQTPESADSLDNSDKNLEINDNSSSQTQTIQPNDPESGQKITPLPLEKPKEDHRPWWLRWWPF